MKSWEKALAVNLNAYGERHIETARAMSHVGSGILNTGGDAQKALSLAEEALCVLLDLTREDSGDTIWADMLSQGVLDLSVVSRNRSRCIEPHIILLEKRLDLKIITRSI